jgi:hypothetical protein
VDLVQAAGQDGLEDILRHGSARVADDIERGEGSPPHGIDVAQRVGRGDLPKGIRIIDDGGEKIQRLDEGDLLRQAVDPGIVRGFYSHQEIRVGPDREARQDFLQDPRRNLGGSTGSPHLLH